MSDFWLSVAAYVGIPLAAFLLITALGVLIGRGIHLADEMEGLS